MTDASSNGSTLAPAPSLREAAAVWFRIGCLGFGGPAGQIALMHRVLVEEKAWIDEDGFLAGLNFCMLLPGPEAQQLAIYVGWRVNGIFGALIAGLLFVLPGAIVIFALSALYIRFSDVGVVAGALHGVQAVVIAVVVEALVRIARRALKSAAAYALAAASFSAIFMFAVPFPVIIAGAALAGFAASRARLDGFSASQALAPPHAAPPLSIRSGLTASLACLTLWLAPVALLIAFLGPEHVFARQAVFFSQMAVVTFGGAYAVLAFVAQQAVEGFGWLTPAQMVDGLGLAETTPGPLVLVLQFVGFIAAANAETGLPLLLAGLIGSVIVLWTTFLPCFAWIFAGGPFIDTIQRIAPLRAALSAVTASVVGVVLNLSLWFAVHVLFGQVGEFEAGPIRVLAPDPASLDLAALALCATALIALLRFKISLLIVLVSGALAGALISLL
ncbi:chromate efflux transporter [Maricaulaceae bacterium MS644]